MGVCLLSQIGPSKDFRVIREDTHAVLMNCQEILQGLRLLKSRGVDFPTYQLDEPVR